MVLRETSTPPGDTAPPGPLGTVDTPAQGTQVPRPPAQRGHASAAWPSAPSCFWPRRGEGAAPALGEDPEPGLLKEVARREVLPGKVSLPLNPLSKAKEAQDDLVKTKEELHLVMTAPPPPPPVYEPVSLHVQESPPEESPEYTGYSAELCSEGILDDRNEEKRITEAEKNERVQRQLMVSGGRRAGAGAWGWGAVGSPTPAASSRRR